jgi:hypothetical protein
MMISLELAYRSTVPARSRKVCAESNTGLARHLSRPIEPAILTFIYAIDMIDWCFSGSFQAAKISP